MEKSGHAVCQPQRADSEGEQILLLLGGLYFIFEDNDENHHRIDAGGFIRCLGRSRKR
jgi:hypothetical protein